MAKSDYGKTPSEGWSRGYEIAWLRIYGKKCDKCNGKRGEGNPRDGIISTCERCGGMGFIKKG